MANVLVILAPQFEEIEAVTPIDYLRRADISVTSAGLNGVTVTSARGLLVQADMVFSDAKDKLYDAIVVPGGKGAWTIADTPEACSWIIRHYQAGKIIAAICAAPALVLGKSCGLLSGKRYTCYPGLEKEAGSGTYMNNTVVEDGTIITARGAGAAGLFSLALIRALAGSEIGRASCRERV